METARKCDLNELPHVGPLWPTGQADKLLRNCLPGKEFIPPDQETFAGLGAGPSDAFPGLGPPMSDTFET